MTNIPVFASSPKVNNRLKLVQSVDFSTLQQQRGLLTPVSLMKITGAYDYGQTAFSQWAILSQCQTQNPYENQ